MGSLRTQTSHLMPCLVCLIPEFSPSMQCALQSSSAVRTALALSSAGSATNNGTASMEAMKSSAVKVGRGWHGADKYLPHAQAKAVSSVFPSCEMRAEAGS